MVGAQLGAQVTIVERAGMGGSAVLTDVVPSKTLIATADAMRRVIGATRVRHARSAMAPPRRVADLSVVNARLLELARDQSADIHAGLERVGVRVVIGEGRLLDAQASQVDPRRRQRRDHRGRRAAGLRGRPPARAAHRQAGWRAHLQLDPGLQPEGDPRAPDRHRFRRHRCRVRLRLQPAGHQGHPGLLARPRAARARTPTPPRCWRRPSSATASTWCPRPAPRPWSATATWSA